MSIKSLFPSTAVVSAVVVDAMLSVCTIVTAAAGESAVLPVAEPGWGIYFAKKKYIPEPLPAFAASRSRLPSPILANRPDLVEMYWKCWELGFSHLMIPPAGSPLVSNWLDASFSENIFQWDTIFMVMFARYGHSAFPAVQSLDNFYCRQRSNGYIARELRRIDGSEVGFGGPANTINPPLFSWAEVESFKLTGDKSRFAAVLPVLEKYVEWLNRDGNPDNDGGTGWLDHGRRAGGSVHHLYWNTPLGSGMDNSPRGGNGWVDMSCQMVIQYENLATMCDELALPQKAAGFRAEARAIGERINRWCWSETDGFYYDVDNDGRPLRVKTAAGFWPLLAGVASKEQAARLVSHLRNEQEFWRPFVFPSLAANDPHYRGDGGYWLGAVWAPTNMAIIKGLERCGFEDFATEATDRYLTAMSDVFKRTGTVWENYAPELPLRSGNPAKADFVGWTGDGPIALLIENILGFRGDGVRHRLVWRLTRTDRHGIERLHVGGITVSAVCEARSSAEAPAAIAVEADGPLELVVIRGAKKRTFELEGGKRTVTVE